MKLGLKLFLGFFGSMLVMISLVACTPTANFAISSAGYLNPDINGQASPVLVTVYQLKSGYAFQQADYESLTNNASKVLGDDIVDKSSFEVAPHATDSQAIKVYPDTKYIGIVAAYRDPNSVSWHKVVPLNRPGSSVSITLNLESEGITIK